MKRLNPDEEIRVLTSLRGFAAVFVMFHHLRYSFVDVAPVNYALFGLAFGDKSYLWVDFFFILSGFILGHRYIPEFEWTAGFLKKFWWKRWLRIYPLHFVTLVAFVSYESLVAGWGEVSQHGSALAANLFLVHGWGHYFGKSWNFPSWSLSAEFAAYLAFPILVGPLLWRGRSRALQVVLASLLLFALAVFYRETEKRHANIAEIYGVLRCALEFSLGLVLFQMRDRFKSSVPGGMAQWVLVGSGVVGVVVLQMKWPDFYFVPCAALVVLFGSLARGRVVDALASWPLYGLGLISFSVYMWHALIGRIFSDLYSSLGKPPFSLWAGAFLFAGLCVVTLAVSTLSYFLIERKLSRAFS